MIVDFNMLRFPMALLLALSERCSGVTKMISQPRASQAT